MVWYHTNHTRINLIGSLLSSAPRGLVNPSRLASHLLLATMAATKKAEAAPSTTTLVRERWCLVGGVCVLDDVDVCMMHEI